VILGDGRIVLGIELWTIVLQTCCVTHHLWSPGNGHKSLIRFVTRWVWLLLL